MAVGCGSVVLLFDLDNVLILKVLLAYIFVAATAAYPALYSNAYHVTRNLQKLKQVESKRFSKDAYFTRRLRAISTKGVWVGGFQTIERASVPLFLNFVFQQVASVVITWR